LVAEHFVSEVKAEKFLYCGKRENGGMSNVKF